MKPKDFNSLKPSFRFKTEVAWKSPNGDLVCDARQFLNGKAILFIRKKRITEAGSRVYLIRLHFTVMMLGRTQKPKYVKNTGVQLGTGKAGSGEKDITRFQKAIVTGKRGNIVIVRCGKERKNMLLVLNFSSDGTKILAKSSTPIKVMYQGEIKASADSRFVFFFSGNAVWTYKIVNERSIELGGRYIFGEKVLRPKGSIIGELTHIFPYKDNKVIVLLSFGLKDDLKFIVLSYKEGKIDMVKNKVKNVDAFNFKGDVKFYRKNDKIYFYDQKDDIYRLTL